MSVAILLAAYGSTHPRAHASVQGMLERIQNAYPHVLCSVAYTSDAVLNRMEERGHEANSVGQALVKMLKNGVTRAVVQSLHIIPGVEFHGILTTANALMLKDGGFERIEVGFPLLAGERDIERVSDAILKIAPKREDKSEAVLFMGHGTMHPGNVYYESLAAHIREKDPGVFIGAMDAEPGIEGIRDMLIKDGVKKAYLLPFLFGAGRHAAKDMVGEKSGSWESILTEKGIECKGILKGAGEYPELAEIWMDHLRDAMLRLERR